MTYIRHSVRRQMTFRDRSRAIISNARSAAPIADDNVSEVITVIENTVEVERLREIVATVQGIVNSVNSPNGTTKKIARIVNAI